MTLNVKTEKTNTTMIFREDLDTNAYLEEMLIDDAQTKILYTTMFVCLLLILLVYVMW